jgi:hypothetical protein
VFLPQALGADEFLRVTWHESDRVVVFSHWQGENCIAATPIRVTDTTDLTALLVDALGDAASNPIPAVTPRAWTLREMFLNAMQRGWRHPPRVLAATWPATERQRNRIRVWSSERARRMP